MSLCNVPQRDESRILCACVFFGGSSPIGAESLGGCERERGSSHWNVQHKKRITRIVESALMLRTICPDYSLNNTHVCTAHV